MRKQNGGSVADERPASVLRLFDIIKEADIRGHENITLHDKEIYREIAWYIEHLEEKAAAPQPKGE